MWWDGAHRKQFILRLYHYVHLRKQTAWKQIEQERERGGESERAIDPLRLQLYIKWIKLIKVTHTVCILSTSFKFEARKTCIQSLLNFHKKMKGRRGVYHLGQECPGRQNGEWRWGRFEYGWGLPKPRLLINTEGHLIPGNQQLQTDS